MAERSDDKKHSQASVNFEHPSTHAGEFCGKCKHYITANPPRCEVTQGPIKPMDWCHQFRTKGLAAS